MDQSVNQETDPTMSDSLCEFNKQHTVDEMRAMIRDLDKKMELKKASIGFLENTIEEDLNEHRIVKASLKDGLAKKIETQKRIEQVKQQLATVKAEKAESKEAERKRTEEDKYAGMTMEQKVELREKLVMQRGQMDEFDANIDNLMMQKKENQKIYSDYRATLKDQENIQQNLTHDHEVVRERREYFLSSCENLKATIEGLREENKRFKFRLENPKKAVEADGESLFQEVTAEKKSLEKELVDLIEITNALRQQIRQKQEEIDELESHENENMCNVDTEYVLSKMRQLVDEYEKICEAVKKVEHEINSGVSQIEQNLKIKSGEQLDLGEQYAILRGYGIDCVKSVGRECNEGSAALKDLFYEFEQLSVEYNALQDKIARAK